MRPFTWTRDLPLERWHVRTGEDMIVAPDLQRAPAPGREPVHEPPQLDPTGQLGRLRQGHSYPLCCGEPVVDRPDQRRRPVDRRQQWPRLDQRPLDPDHGQTSTPEHLRRLHREPASLMHHQPDPAAHPGFLRNAQVQRLVGRLPAAAPHVERGGVTEAALPVRVRDHRSATHLGFESAEQAEVVPRPGLGLLDDEFCVDVDLGQHATEPTGLDGRLQHPPRHHLARQRTREQSAATIDQRLENRIHGYDRGSQPTPVQAVSSLLWTTDPAVDIARQRRDCAMGTS